MSNGLQLKQPSSKFLLLPTEEEIRRRAYEIYCARKGDFGDAVGDWLRAEWELKEKYKCSKERPLESINIFA